MSNEPSNTEQPSSLDALHNISAQQVRAWLRAHPDFLPAHPELLSSANASLHDEEVVLDFRGHQIRHLQARVVQLQGRVKHLVDALRQNHSVQQQIHYAALAIIQAETLEDMLELITCDMHRWFGVDVIRLVLETELAEYYPDSITHGHDSGLLFMPPPAVHDALASIALYAKDACAHSIIAAAAFHNCQAYAHSAAIIPLLLPLCDRRAYVCIGSKQENFYHPQQSTHLLQFLCDIIQDRLDVCLMHVQEI